MSGLRILKKTYTDIYKNIYAVAFSSFAWFLTGGVFVVVTTVGVEVGSLLPGVVAAIFIGPATAGCFYITNRIVNYERVRFKDFFIGVKRFFFPALGISLLWSLIVSILVVDFYFFVSSSYRLLNLISPFWIYLLIYFGIVSIYLFPLLIEFDRLEDDFSLLDVFKYSLLLTSDDIKYTLLIFINIFLFGGLTSVIFILLPILFMGGISLTANNAAVNLLVNQGVKTEVTGPYDYKE